jgi:hypothetical protein
MTIKITTPNGGSDSLDFGCAQTAIVATVTGTEVSSGEGKLELKTTTGGTSATKATVLANGNVGIGITAPTAKLEVYGPNDADNLIVGHNNTDFAVYHDGAVGEVRLKAVDGSGSNYSKYMTFYTQPSGAVAAERMRITSDGRGLSQFTAKAWINFNGEGTIAIRDSHNVASITDLGTGRYTVTLTNNMANTNYMVSATAGNEQSDYASQNDAGDHLAFVGERTVSLFKVFSADHDDGLQDDCAYMGAIIFGD